MAWKARGASYNKCRCASRIEKGPKQGCDAAREMLRKLINEMRHFLQTQTNRITEYDEQLVRRPISKITVYDGKLIFEFKSGMTLELKR
ncbi:hypothetical protein [Canibacter zhuwentaonis]|uniref:hypothetical protein n=1 Tax=Canibacter zhuwentaonis TaxID=2837491 RepID=UPI003D6DDCFF